MNSFKEMLKRCVQKEYLSWNEAEAALQSIEDYGSLQPY